MLGHRPRPLLSHNDLIADKLTNAIAEFCQIIFPLIRVASVDLLHDIMFCLLLRISYVLLERYYKWIEFSFMTIFLRLIMQLWSVISG